jgi:hypothetical protein
LIVAALIRKLSRAWSGWDEVLVIVKPATVIAWWRRKFRQHWARLSRSGKPDRPTNPREVDYRTPVHRWCPRGSGDVTHRETLLLFVYESHQLKQVGEPKVRASA